MRTVTAAELPGLADRIVERIRERGDRIDTVVCIESAGRPLGELLAPRLGAVLVPLRPRGRKSRVRQALLPLLRHAPHWFLAAARKADVLLRVRRKQAPPLEGDLPSAAHHILVVDDAVDSGVTLAAAVDWCRSMAGNAATVTSAVLTTTGKRPVARADISLFHEPCAFPWSLVGPGGA